MPNFIAAGVKAFLKLLDTPASFAGEAGNFLKVNAGETALEFGAAGGVTDEQLKTITISLTAADIIAMYGTPITAIPAPGAGKAIVIDQAVFSFSVGGTQFTSGGATRFQFSGTTNALTTTFSATVMTGAADKIMGNNSNSGITILANTLVQITNATAAFADGDGTLKVFIRYRIITL